MDILAHGLWTAAAAKAANQKLRSAPPKTISVGWSAFWGVAPDLFAFIIPFSVLIFESVFGDLPFGLPHPGSVESLPPDVVRAFSFTPALYRVSHSAVVFTGTFFAVWGMRALSRHRRGTGGKDTAAPLPMLGWLLHILIDIPTHTPRFYPTPFLWPLSDFNFRYGVSWGTPVFMVLNYGSLLLVYLFFLLRKKSKAIRPES